jgi:tetratricopeptide (TPR) repeat protein
MGLSGLLLLAVVLPGRAADVAVPELPRVRAGAISNRVHQAYVEFGDRFARESTNSHAAVEFARACFDRADFATNGAQRAAIAEQGIAASRRAIRLAPDSAAARFYLGVNLGQLARVRLFSALGLLNEMEATWKKSAELDATYNYAAANRCLGLLYFDAPGWPLSLGSRTRARRHLQKAVELAPDYPDNRLCLFEARLRWGEAKTVQSQFPAMEATLRSARTNFVGDAWARDWEDWETRWKKIKARVGTTVSARSPRDPR